jgi:hypothetical protein
LLPVTGRNKPNEITFYAHASCPLETAGLSVVTDPYAPGLSRFTPIDEPANVVSRSSATRLIPLRLEPCPWCADRDKRAVGLPSDGQALLGVPIRAFPTSESLTLDYGRDATAIHLFTLGGIRVLHLG